MNNETLNALKYPVGKFVKPAEISKEHIQAWISEIENFPESIKQLTQNLSDTQKNWKYRPNGWTIKQIVHHCVDSHINSYVRFKLCLTEDTPTIRPYYEDRWATLIDANDNVLDNSLMLLAALHNKWVQLIKSLKSEEFKLCFIHPDTNSKITLEENVGIYAWHCRHHLAHIQQAIDAKGVY